MSKIDKHIKKLKGLKPFKDKSDEDLRAFAAQPSASKELRAKLAQFTIVDRFRLKDERKLAKTLLEKYLQDYDIESISDCNTLEEIIFLEVIQLRLQDKMNEEYAGDVKAVPFDTLDVLHKNSEAITDLKATLGLNRNSKGSSYDLLQHMLKRFKVWRSQNQGSRTMKCPHCLKAILLKIRTEAWEAQSHPFFEDTILYNKALFARLGESITIDREFIALVLNVSPDYIDWVLTKVKPQTRKEYNGSETQTETEVKEEAKVVSVTPASVVEVESVTVNVV